MRHVPVVFSFLCISLVSQFCLAFEFSESHHKNAKMLMDKAYADDLGYALVESLTTEVGPRLAGTEAESRARDWAVKNLKSLGFKNVRVEEFAVPTWQRGIEKAAIISPFPQHLVVTALGGSMATPEEGVQGEVVIVPTVDVLSKVKDNALQGKIVFVDEVMARTQDGSGYGVAVKKRRLTAYEAHRAGAVAALIRSVGTSNHRFAHTGQMKRIIETDPGLSVPTAALSSPDADQIARIVAGGESVTLSLTLTPKTMPEGVSGNVIAEIPGTKASDEIVLLGAHLDSWDLGTGAVDDGAGVGIVVAAANLIKQSLKKRPRRTIRVVLFGAEEVGLVGAKRYAEMHKDELGKHIFAAESDFGADVIWRFGTANVADNKLAVVNAISEILRPLKITPGDNKSRGGPDLKFIAEAGVPVADLRQNGLDYFDLHHTADDTFDKVDKDKMRQNIAAYAAMAYLVANMEEDFR